MSVKLKIFLTYIMSCSAVLGFFFDSSAKLYNGTLRPLDPDVCTSQNITFTCTLLSPSVPGNSIGFAVKNESTEKMYLPVSVGRVTVINDTSSEFTIYDVSASTYIYVRCYYWEIFGDLDESRNFGETSTASIYTMPKKVEKINCLVENYNKNMICSWIYHTEYKPKNFPDVIFLWRIPTLSATWNTCPDLNKETGSCYWNSTRAGDFSMKPIDVKLTLKEPCGVNVSSDFRIDTTQIVKPYPVVGLRSTVLNSTCIRVQWGTNNSEMQYPKEHRVIVSSKWNEPWVSKFTTTVATEKDAHVMTFCDLHPHTEYTFAVSIQPTGDQAGFFSVPREVVATTYSDIPSASPEVTKGGYSWNARECEGGSTKRRVCLFWKPIHEEDKNGPMKGLEASFSTQNKIQFNENWAEDSTYGCSPSLLCNTTYVFSIKARNGNGTSETASTLVISAATSGISLPQLIVEATNGSNVSVSWTSTRKAKGFLVVWCRNKNGACGNQNMVNWQVFSPDKRDAVIQINSANTPQDLLYGVSVLTDQGSSGLEWEDCVYFKNADPNREPQNVVVSTGSKDNTLVVTWDKLTCKSDEPYIDMYNVRYNKLNEKSQKSVNVSASGEARVVLENLDESQRYVVTVRGITKDGRFGPESHPQTGKPENRSLKPGEIVGIVMAVLVVLTFAGAGCFFCARKCKKGAQQVVKNNNICIPEDSNLQYGGVVNDGVDRSSVKTIERQNSDDSGIDPRTPPTEKFVDQPNFVDLPNKRPQPQPQVRPDDYVYATREHGPITDNSDFPAVELSWINATNLIQPEPTVARVGYVMEENNRTNDETFVKRIDRESDENETALKARVKSVSGDSGVSDTYSRATLSGLEKKKNTENKVDVDKNTVNAEFSLPSNEAPDYIRGNTANNSSFSDTNSKTGLSFENCTLQNISGAKNEIPKPLAFSEYSESDNSFSDQEDMPTGPITDTNTETSTDYVKAQSTPDLVSAPFSHDYVKAQTDLTNSTSTNSDNIQYQLHDHETQNEDNKTEGDQVLKGISVPPLTNIPCPRDTNESDSSSSEEENVSLPSHLDAFPVVPLPDVNRSGNMVVKNNNTPTTHQLVTCNSQQENINRLPPGYVTTPPGYVTNTDMSDTPVKNLLSDTGYFTMSNGETGVSERLETPTAVISHNNSDHTPASTPECLPSKKNQDASSGYVTSVSNPEASHAIHLPQMSPPVVLKAQPNALPNQCTINLLPKDLNIKIPIPSSARTDEIPSDDFNNLSTAATDNSDSAGYVPQSGCVQSPAGSAPTLTSGEYVSPSSAVEGQLSPVVDVKSPMHSPCFQNFGAVLQECVPTTDAVQDGTHQSMFENGIQSGIVQDNMSSPVSESIAIDHISSENNCLPRSDGYVMGTDTNSLLVSSLGKDVEPDNASSTTNETHHQYSESSSANGQSLHKDTDTNGYVDYQFLTSSSLYTDQLNSEDKESRDVQMRNTGERENVDEHGSERGSDSGLSSLGHESPETLRRQSEAEARQPETESKQPDTNTGYVSC